MPKTISDSGLAVTVLSASLMLSACGGGGGGSDSSGGDASTLKAGLYDAEIARVNGSEPQIARTYLSPTGELAIDFGGGFRLESSNLIAQLSAALVLTIASRTRTAKAFSKIGTLGKVR
jgi:hypothetical protein